MIFRVWVVILAFVDTQLAWNLRPFLGDQGQPLELVREQEGNFYTAMAYAVGDLFKGNGSKDGDNTPPVADGKVLEAPTPAPTT